MTIFMRLLIYYVSVSQKLVILGFSPQIFFHFDLGHFRCADSSGNQLLPEHLPKDHHVSVTSKVLQSAESSASASWLGLHLCLMQAAAVVNGTCCGG